MSKSKKKKTNPSPEIRDPEKLSEVRHIRQSIQISRISSPIPPPEIMEKYNTLMPNATEKFFSLVERQSIHRQEIEKKEVKSQNFRASLGLICGWSLTIILATYGFILLNSGKELAGYTAFIAGVIPRVISFFIARHDRKEQLKEIKEKNK